MKREDALAIMRAAGYPDAQATFVDGGIMRGWRVVPGRNAAGEFKPAPRNDVFLPNLRTALLCAGFDAPMSAAYSDRGYDVILRGIPVAVAASKTMAKRIANALNEYTPDERGR